MYGETEEQAQKARLDLAWGYPEVAAVGGHNPPVTPAEALGGIYKF